MSTRRLFAIIVLISQLITLQAAQAQPIGDQLNAAAQVAPQTATYYVDAVNGNNLTGDGSAAAPWKTITFALTHTTEGDVVVIAPGLYDSTLGETFPITLKPGLQIIGAGRDSTILSGLSSDVIVSIGNGAADFPNTTRVSGLTLQNGSYGLSLYSTQGHFAAPRLTDLRIRGNVYGILMYTSDVYHYGATLDPVISNTEVISNSQSGIYVSSYGYFSASSIAPEIIDCLVAYNGSQGLDLNASAVNANGSSTNPHIVNTRIQNNGGHGIWTSGAYQGWVIPQIERSWIDNNAGDGFGWAQGANRGNIAAAITDTMITRNQSGGIYLGDIGGYEGGGGSLRLVNVTIAENSLYGIYWSNQNGRVQPDVVNSIIWNTTADDLYTTTGTPWSTTEIHDSDIQDGDLVGLQGNLSVDPGFADAAHGDFHLLPMSPVLDSGSAAIVHSATDIDGDVRLLGSAVAMGADETQPYTVTFDKSVTPTGIVPTNAVLTYTLTITNLSPFSAGGVLITDSLPSEVTRNGYVVSNFGHASIVSNTLQWLGTLPASSASAIIFTARPHADLPVGTVITNVATLDNRTGQIATTSPVIVTAGPTVIWDTSVQTMTAPYVRPGQRITYTLSARNTGNVSAYDAIVTDTLDSHVTFAAADAGGVWDTDRVVWNGLTVTNGVAITLTVAVTINTPLSDTMPIVNQVNVSGGQSSFALPIVTTTVYNPPLADFDAAPTMGAVPVKVTLTDHSQHATNYLWTYGDGASSTVNNNHQHTYSTAGFYTVTLRVSNPIGSSILTRTNYITAYNAASAYFTGNPITGLWPLTVALTNSSANANQFIWDYGDGLTSTIASMVHSHQYAAPGFYTVTLTAIGPYDQNTHTRISYIRVYEPPSANFTASPRTGVSPLLVNFTNYSTNSSSYRWDFGDGSISYSINPNHYYFESGIYTVTLTAYNPGGEDTLIRTAYITVHAPPTAQFSGTPTVGPTPLTVTFTNSSVEADTYLWEYGDGQTSATMAITHTYLYNSPGTYTVKLTAFNAYGQHTQTRTNYIAAYTPPQANFTAQPLTGVSPLSVNFTNLSQNATAYLWAFGDGSTSTETDPTHVYAASGVFTVSLQVNNPGSSAVFTQTNYITVYARPVPDFVGAPLAGFYSQTVTLTNTSQFADTYMWNYGDGQSSLMDNITHTHFYSQPGSYTVTLTAIKLNTAVTLTRPSYITIFTTAVPDFQAVPISGSLPLTVTFSNTSLGADQFLWEFGDGVTSTLAAPTHVYTIAGDFTVTLTAANPFMAATLVKPQYILAYHKPVVDFYAAPRFGPAPLIVTFAGDSLYADAFLWSYGDGITGTTTALTHTHLFTTPGVYTISLQASNPYSAAQQTRAAYVFVHAPTQAGTYYVDAASGSNESGDGSVSAPWKTITYALSQVAGANIEIRAASGVYNQALGESFPIVMKSGISLIGAGYPHTVIAGHSSNYGVQFVGTTAYSTTTVLHGFKITGASQGVHIDGVGGDGTAPTIEANWITGNGDGIVNDAYYGQRIYAVIRDNLITANTSTGVYNNANRGVAIASPQLIRNTIQGNVTAGVYCYATGSGYAYNGDYGVCAPYLTGNLIADNTGDGYRCHTAYTGGCSPTFVGNTIVRNGGWGIGRAHDWTYLLGCDSKFYNNIIADNGSGGAVFINPIGTYGERDWATFVNNTIVDNHNYGILDGYPTIVNNIVWGQTSDLNAPVDSVSYNDVSQGVYAGQNNNLSVNPQFVNRASGNYHLLSTAPIIDMGDSNRSDLPATDLDGNPRIMGVSVDMGAYESPIGLAGSIGMTPNPVMAGQAITSNLQITNTGVITLHTIITDVLSPHVTPTNPLTWTATITPGSVWSRAITATVVPDYAGPITNNLLVTSLEGPSGFFTATAQALIPVSGLFAVNNGPTVLGQPTILTATITGGSAVTYTWSLGDLTTDFGPHITHTYPFTGIYTTVVTATNSVGAMTATTTVWVIALPLEPRVYLPLIMFNES